MAEVKKSGIVIKILDYDDYDQIVTVLSSNELISFIALGVRKMTSKNRVALQLGNIIEIEIFAARLKGKLSKLKRATLIKQPPIKEADTALVLLEIIKYLNKVESPIPTLLNSIYESYDYLGGEYNHHVKTYIVSKIPATVGEAYTTNGCVECGRSDRIVGFDFYKGGYTCFLHAPKERELSFLKGITSLQKSIREYIKVEHKTNSNIFQELINFINSSNW